MLVFRDLQFMDEHPPSLKLAKHLGESVKLPNGTRMPRVDMLCQLFASTIVTSIEVSAVAVFCWDEKRAFGQIRAGPPGMWLATRLGNAFPGYWKAEGYGFTLKSGCPVARWIAWDEPEEEEDCAAVYEAVSATYKMNEFMQTIDLTLAEHLVSVDSRTQNSGAFIVAASAHRIDAEGLVVVAKEAVREYLGSCSD
jgi:hypothetical protein